MEGRGKDEGREVGQGEAGKGVEGSTEKETEMETKGKRTTQNIKHPFAATPQTGKFGCSTPTKFLYLVELQVSPQSQPGGLYSNRIRYYVDANSGPKSAPTSRTPA